MAGDEQLTFVPGHPLQGGRAVFQTQQIVAKAGPIMEDSPNRAIGSNTDMAGGVAPTNRGAGAAQLWRLGGSVERRAVAGGVAGRPQGPARNADAQRPDHHQGGGACPRCSGGQRGASRTGE